MPKLFQVQQKHTGEVLASASSMDEALEFIITRLSMGRGGNRLSLSEIQESDGVYSYPRSTMRSRDRLIIRPIQHTDNCGRTGKAPAFPNCRMDCPCWCHREATNA